jgi:hypothetical protein
MKSSVKNVLILSVFILTALTEGYSRAGGGGGHHSSGGGGGGFHSSGGGSFGSGGIGSGVFFGGSLLPVVVIGILVVLAIIYFSKFSKKNGAGVDDGPDSEVDLSVLGAEFNKEAFIQKVVVAFSGIQNAWQEKNLANVRRWITDGVYQRFNAQFVMMKILEQENKLSNIRINRIQIQSAEQQGTYSTITASINFTMDDEFICKKDSSLNEEYDGDTATEYWTFIRKTGIVEKDLYHSNSCPHCGDALNSDGGEVSKCASCGSITYLGDYDWVLCEITQSEDYSSGAYALKTSDPILAPVLADQGDSFCVPLMEDKASNAVMQYFESIATRDLKYLHRFTTDALSAKIGDTVKASPPIVFSRLFLNNVDLVQYDGDGGSHRLVFNIGYSAMRIEKRENKFVKIDSEAEPHRLQLVLKKKSGVGQKNKLWGFECSCCGAPYSDTTDTTCSYCSAKINSSENDWVMDNLSTV